MRHTLKAVFDHRTDAQHVLDALLAAGYPNTDMALSRAPPTRRADGGGIPASGEDEESLGDTVKRTFTRLFRSHHQQTMDHFNRFIRGGHVVTLNTGSELEAKSAVGIFERFGPVDIKDLDDELDHGSTGAPGDAADSTEAEKRQPQPMSYRLSAPGPVSMGWDRADRLSSVYPQGTAPGAGAQWEPADDDGTPDARSSPGSGSHDNDMEAYRYGHEMRTNDNYRYCSWDEIEPWLKKDWEARSPSASTWDESKSAVRRGWNSTSPDIEDDRYFRAHWNAIYRDSAGKPDYDDRTPAYLYGSEARRSEIYQSHDWRDVEQDIEADWKARHAGQLSSWGDFKDAVKHGWNRVSPGMDEKDAAGQSQHGSGDAGDGAGIGNDDRATTIRPGSDSFERKSS